MPQNGDVPFLRSLKYTAPKWNRDLRWPIDGLVYVAAFMGPIAAGPLLGLLTRNWTAIALGLPLGIAITFTHAWLSDTFFDPLIARYQVTLLRIGPRILVNALGFAWALLLSTLAMFAPAVVLGSPLL